MSSSLHEVWEAAASSAFQPAISKDNQFLVGFSLLLLAFVLTGVFALNRSLLALPTLALPASIAFGFGAVYMICAVAVSSSAKQLFILLRCVSFSNRAHVQLDTKGIRFSVEEGNALQGFAFLDKSLFTTYRFDSSNFQPEDDGGGSAPIFQISLAALLETLQILGFADGKDRNFSRDSAFPDAPHDPMNRNGTSAAFDNRVLGLSSICRLTYEGPGSPLAITLEEGNVTTTCNLVTYEPDDLDDIPFDRSRLALKIVMRSTSLHDAITELNSLSPDQLILVASPSTPHLSLSASGSLGSASVDFSKDAQLLETFQVPRRTRNAYKFAHIKAALKAMAVAAKVSIRGDEQGVLSLQFMIEMEAGGVCFVDFRFVPFIEDGEADGEDADEAGSE